jgi:endonuclease/exonuclease/phosphatase family metal-dependent hydrolase
VRRAEPSILCIQEVRDRAAAEALAQRSGLGGLRVVACTEFAAPEGAPGTQQVAILSNLPVRESGTERWRTKGTIDPPRGYAYALLDTPVGPVAVFSVHLKSNFIPKDLDVGEQTLLNRRKREVAADQLRGAAARLRTRAGAVSRVIVAGDFNTSLDDTRWAEETTLRRFATDGYVSCFDGTPTRRTRTLNASGTNPAATFDYILHRGFGSQRNLHVDPRRWVSDHRMVSVCLAP